MSVTFTISTIEKSEFDGEMVDVRVPVDGAEDLEITLSNSNAADLLRFIGLDDELWGNAEAAQVMGACMIALELRGAESDPALEACVLRAGPDHFLAGVTIHECARREGYLHDRARELLAIAEKALEDGHAVSWC